MGCHAGRRLELVEVGLHRCLLLPAGTAVRPRPGCADGMRERGAYWPTAAGTAAMLASMPTITTIATTIMSMRANRDPGIAGLPVVLELERHGLVQLPQHG